MSSLRLDLPSSLRHELKEPLGPIYTDADELLTAAAEPIVAVGDIVTYHLLEAGYTPAVAFVDDRTKRAAVDPEVRDAVGGFDHCRTVDNPAGTITGSLIGALSRGLGEDGTTLIRVDGEEDLAALPAVLAVPEGASVVYGQPDEGMVLVTADAAARERCRDLIGRMDGPADELLAALS
ncbi:GTP-dependent dephospho-CoA kinase family protein [Halomicrobium sp. HM KBTZ05]|uniref:GTP-dependent dephospho-CoA kinase n=1 Tax=Halomicrobium mukohataei TaxID=57705 RepID=A0A847UCN9_9EURY|nr:DUF359 domain-containing protein [Halomicrobium mukohataei]